MAGIRWKKGGRDTIATLLLGLYDDDGNLNYVGSAAVGAKNQAEIAAKVLPLVDQKNDRRFSEPNRWGSGELEETALKPKLVVEVRFDKLEKHRFRHGTRLLRFRPDKNAKDCTWREVRPPRRPDDLAVEDLLRSGPARHTFGTVAATTGRARAVLKRISSTQGVTLPTRWLPPCRGCALAS